MSWKREVETFVMWSICFFFFFVLSFLFIFLTRESDQTAMTCLLGSYLSPVYHAQDRGIPLSALPMAICIANMSLIEEQHYDNLILCMQRRDDVAARATSAVQDRCLQGEFVE